jgi:hypothetical protein
VIDCLAGDGGLPGNDWTNCCLAGDGDDGGTQVCCPAPVARPEAREKVVCMGGGEIVDCGSCAEVVVAVLDIGTCAIG